VLVQPDSSVLIDGASLNLSSSYGDSISLGVGLHGQQFNPTLCLRSSSSDYPFMIGSNGF